MKQERTINALNECHRNINIKSDLDNDSATNESANMIHENYKFVITI